jgi:tripartite-type tricarboxylate transporter receptor subunit TctC
MALLANLSLSIIRRALACAMLVSLGSAVAAFAQAPAFPSKPLKIVVPSSPGGGLDILARLMGRKLTENVGQPVLIDNKGGGGGVVGTEQAMRSPPDGYTILIGPIASFGLAPSLYKSLPYDPVRDFAPITKGVVVTNVLVVHPSLPVKTAKEFVALLKAKPGAFNCGTAGYGSAGHLAGELFSLMAGVEFTQVPYKGGGPAVADLVAGHVHFNIATVPSALPFITSGKLRPLGVTTPNRFPSLPEVPTIGEAAIAGYEASNWFSFFAPADTPKDIIAVLNNELRRAMASPDVSQALLSQGMAPTPSSPEELGAYLKSEIAKWAEVVKVRGIKAE